MAQSEREILDREYNARESVPSFATEYARYVTASAAAVRAPPEISASIEAVLPSWTTSQNEALIFAGTLSSLGRHADLVYDPASGQTLDLYPAEGGGPLFVWVHGGYWRALSKDDNASAALGLVRTGRPA